MTTYFSITLALACEDINELATLLVWVIYTPNVRGKGIFHEPATIEFSLMQIL